MITENVARHVYNGGRCLNAIWDSEAFSTSEKIFLLFLGSNANYEGTFTEFHFHSLTKLSEATGLGKRTIFRIAGALEERGYILRKKNYDSNRTQLPSGYAITPKIFEEYKQILQEATHEQ